MSYLIFILAPNQYFGINFPQNLFNVSFGSWKFMLHLRKFRIRYKHNEICINFVNFNWRDYLYNFGVSFLWCSVAVQISRKLSKITKIIENLEKALKISNFLKMILNFRKMISNFNWICNSKTINTKKTFTELKF